ncbi:hypothetical protein LCGC14_1697690 [marine sediment metagenome]|uniref:Uncharacterized protein n=1 Tax=marine sediment metagenome TaxID=412755 RepID=A0A0F9KIX7_9ZZZZ
MWHRVSGGCFTQAGGAELKKYPCDDDWENKETGRIVKIHSTYDRHFDLPKQVVSLDEIYILEGTSGSQY